jgi:ketosteroid isomerase-like protein
MDRQRSDGSVPDRVTEEGVAVYTVAGTKSPTDNPQALVSLAAEYERQTGDRTLLEDPRLTRAMHSIPRDESGLVWIDPDSPHSSYGFTDWVIGPSGSFCCLRDTVRAMSQENVELAYRAFDALNRRELDAFLALMDDDIEVVPRVSAIEGESNYRGHDGVRRWWSSMLDVFPDYSMEVVEMRDLGDLTFATFHARGHGAGSAAPTDNAAWIVARWRRGKVVWWSTFNARALETLGLSEQDAHADS